MTTAYVASNQLPMAALPTVGGIFQRFPATVTNTGDATYAPDGLAASPIYGLGGQPLQGNEIVAGGNVTLVSYIGPLLNSGNLCWVLLDCTGGAQQVAPAVQSQQAVQFGQVAGVVGSARNLQLVVATASNSASLTADEIIVETALGGLRYCLSSFSQTINLATTGAGGMDAGSAPATGFVALYAIYNPATKAAALLATGLASTAPPNTYGGGHMPAGYTASALLSIWATNSSGQLAVGYQYDRTREFPIVDVFSTSTSASTPTIFSIASAVPLGAKSFGGTMTSRNSTAGAGTAAAIMGSASGIGQTNCNSSAGSANFGVSIGYKNVPILVPQTAYYTMSASTGGPGFQVAVGSYTI